MTSLGSQMRRHGGRLPGLPTTALLLLLGIFVTQSAEISDYMRLGAARIASVGALSLPMLFTLAGLTLGMGATRHPPRDFLVKRLFLYWPPLIMSVVAAMALIGPLATWWPLRSYAQSPELYRHLLNLVAWPVPELPGAFETNSFAREVNAAYWTAPLILAGTFIAMLAARIRHPAPLIAALVALLAAVALLAVYAPGDLLNGNRVTAALCLLLGLLAWHLRQHLPMSGIAAAVAALLLLAITRIGSADWAANIILRIACAAPTAYLALWLATQPLPSPRAVAHGYRARHFLYLLAFPVQQLISTLADDRQGWLANAAIALPLVLAAALGGAQMLNLVLRRFPLPETVTDHADPGIRTDDAGPRTKARAPRQRRDRRELLSRSLRVALVSLLFLTTALAAIATLMLALERDVEGM